jgi:hypothetical protein
VSINGVVPGLSDIQNWETTRLCTPRLKHAPLAGLTEDIVKQEELIVRARPGYYLAVGPES